MGVKKKARHAAYRAFMSRSCKSTESPHMLVHGDLECFHGLNQHVQLLGSAGVQHLLDAFRRDVFAESRGVIEKGVRLHVQRLRNLDEHRQAQLRVAGLYVAHVRYGNVSLIGKSLLRQSACLSIVAYALSYVVVFHPFTAHTIHLHLNCMEIMCII